MIRRCGVLCSGEDMAKTRTNPLMCPMLRGPATDHYGTPLVKRNRVVAVLASPGSISGNAMRLISLIRDPGCA